MSRKDLESNIDVVQSLAPASHTATADGAGVDLRDYASAMVLIDAGAIGGTGTPTFTFEVQESDDDATYTAVAAADLQGTEPVITAGGEVHRIGYKGSKRYLRAAISAVSGTSPTLLASASVVRGDPHVGPL